MTPRTVWLPEHALPLHDRRLLIALFAVLAAAYGLRALFYTGFFGSDEVTYLEAAVRILHGDWTPSSYIGAIRYGVQLPMAGLMAVFGQNEFAANLWPLSCSLAEIAAVLLIGNALIGFRASLLAATLLSVLPLHVHFAGRLMADPPQALFMTLSFLLFWLGNRKNLPIVFLLAGLSAGVVFWIKEVSTIYLLVLLCYPIVFRCWNWKWLWMLAGFLLMFAANCCLMWVLSGDPLYIVHIAANAASEYSSETGRFSRSPGNDDPMYYLGYLFVRVYHFWILGYLAIAALGLAWRHRGSSSGLTPGTAVALWWGLGLIALFSLFPVSLHPPKFVFKQVNYMLMFAPPLAMLAGMFLSRLRTRTLASVLTITVIPMFFLSALEKNVVAIFTANSKAAVSFARDHATATVYGTSGAQRAATFYGLTRPQSPAPRIQPIDALLDEGPCAAPGERYYAIIDPETQTWGRSRLKRIDDLPDCWHLERTLTDGADTSLRRVFELLSRAIDGLPTGATRDKVKAAIAKMSDAQAALVYSVRDGSDGRQRHAEDAAPGRAAADGVPAATLAR